jgi:hypothetical protein
MSDSTPTPPAPQDQQPAQAPQAAPVQLQIDISKLSTAYANICRIAQTPNEVIVDFGLNPNFFGNILEEPLRLDQRIILSPDAAKRLCLHLNATLQSYEARYGVIELDIERRLTSAARAAAKGQA